MAVATGALSIELEFAENQLDSLVTSEERRAPAVIPATAASLTQGVTTTQSLTPAQAVATPAATPVQTAPSATPAQAAPAVTPTERAPVATRTQTAPAATSTQTPAATPPQAASTAAPTPGPSIRRGRKRTAGSVREECYRSIRQGAETTSDELKLALRAFADVCEKNWHEGCPNIGQR